MTPNDVLDSQRRWRSLYTRGEARVVQFFADHSPEHWWYSRYNPSTSEGSIQSSFLSRAGFATQLHIALSSTNASVAVFHKRTITYDVFKEAVGRGYNVRPVFVVDGVKRATTDASLPLVEWSRLVKSATEDQCLLAAETPEDFKSLRSLCGEQFVRYLPKMVVVPQDLPLEGKSPSPALRVLLCAQAYPDVQLPEVLLALSRWASQQSREIELNLLLGSGMLSSQALYRTGVVVFAGLLFDNVVVRDWMPRLKFLCWMVRDVDLVLSPGGRTSVAIEAGLLGIPVCEYRDGEVRDQPSWSEEERGEFQARKSARYSFWRSVR